MSDDPRLLQARDWHRRAEEHKRLAGVAREERNRLVRELSAEGVPSHTIARCLGCSAELVSHVLHGRVGPGTRGRRPRELT